MGLLARVFVVWCQVVGQRGRDMLSATAFNQQVRAYVRMLEKSAMLHAALANLIESSCMPTFLQLLSY